MWSKFKENKPPEIFLTSSIWDLLHQYTNKSTVINANEKQSLWVLVRWLTFPVSHYWHSQEETKTTSTNSERIVCWLDYQQLKRYVCHLRYHFNRGNESTLGTFELFSNHVWKLIANCEKAWAAAGQKNARIKEEARGGASIWPRTGFRGKIVRGKGSSWVELLTIWTFSLLSPLCWAMD